MILRSQEITCAEVRCAVTHAVLHISADAWAAMQWANDEIRPCYTRFVALPATVAAPCHETQTDMALAKRAHAVSYMQRRRALRKALRLNLPAEIVREVRRQIVNYRAAWAALRMELRA